MNRIFISIISLIAALPILAQTYTESYNIVSEGYKNKIENVKIIRNINGGTVIIPEFDESCPEEIKAPFMFACKIVEEYMPTSLPLRIKVTVDELSTRLGKRYSKVNQARQRFVDVRKNL